MTHFQIDIGDAASLANAKQLESFYFLRHGRTDHNLRSICQGSRDIPLDAVGEEQAVGARRIVTRLPIERVVTSPLSRASRTALLATDGMGLPPCEEPRIMERGFGDHEGSLAPQGLWESDLPTVETRAVRNRRVGAALLAHCDRPGTIIVAHGGVLRVIAALLQFSLLPVQLENARPLFLQKTPSGWIVQDISISIDTLETAR
jgi:broad specificity phosphatase PhoE